MKNTIFISFFLIVSNAGCLQRTLPLTPPDSNEISIDSFYHILGPLCDKVNKTPNFYYSDKPSARQYLMLYNTIFNYRGLLIRDKNDSIRLRCITRETVEKIALKYNGGHLLARKNYIKDLNIYVPATGEKMSYYQIKEVKFEGE